MGNKTQNLELVKKQGDGHTQLFFNFMFLTSVYDWLSHYDIVFSPSWNSKWVKVVGN